MVFIIAVCYTGSFELGNTVKSILLQIKQPHSFILARGFKPMQVTTLVSIANSPLITIITAHLNVTEASYELNMQPIGLQTTF